MLESSHESGTIIKLDQQLLSEEDVPGALNLLTLLIFQAVLGCHLIDAHNADSPRLGLMLPKAELEVGWDDLQLVRHLMSA